MKIHQRHHLRTTARAIFIGCSVSLLCAAIPFLVRAQESGSSDGRQGLEFARLLGRLQGIWVPAFSIPATLVWSDWFRDGRAQSLATQGVRWTRVVMPSCLFAALLFAVTFAAIREFTPPPRLIGESRESRGHLEITLRDGSESQSWRIGSDLDPWRIEYESRAPRARGGQLASSTAHRRGNIGVTAAATLLVLVSMLAGMGVAARVEPGLARLSVLVPLLGWISYQSLQNFLELVLRRPASPWVDTALVLLATLVGIRAALIAAGALAPFRRSTG